MPLKKKAVKKKSGATPAALLMCCSIEAVRVRFDEESYQNSSIDTSRSDSMGTDSVFRVKASRIDRGNYGARLFYKFNDQEFLAQVRQGVNNPGQPGDKLPPGVTELILELQIPTALPGDC